MAYLSGRERLTRRFIFGLITIKRTKNGMTFRIEIELDTHKNGDRDREGHSSPS